MPLTLPIVLVALARGQDELRRTPIDSTAGRIAVGARLSPALKIRIDRRGSLQLLVEPAWEYVTLDVLGDHLKRLAVDYTREHRDDGKEPDEDYPSFKRLRLAVEVDADAMTPWQHIVWVLYECSQYDLLKFHLRTSGSALNLTLPPNIAIEWTDPPDEIAIRVDVVGEGDISRVVNGVRVHAPKTVGYRIAGKQQRDLSELSGGLERYKALAHAAKATELLVGHVGVDYKVPVGEAMKVLRLFVEADIARLVLSPVRLPTAAERSCYPLPFPSRDRG